MPGTPQHNRQVERKFTTLLNMHMLCWTVGTSSFLRNDLWAEAANTAMLHGHNLISKKSCLFPKCWQNKHCNQPWWFLSSKHSNNLKSFTDEHPDGTYQVFNWYTHVSHHKCDISKHAIWWLGWDGQMRYSSHFLCGVRWERHPSRI